MLRKLFFFKKLSIRWKVSLSTSIYILFLLFGSIFLTALSFEQKLINEKNAATIENIKGIVDSYLDSFILRNLEKIDEMIKKIKDIPSVEKVQVIDFEGRIIGNSNISNLGKIDRYLLTKFINNKNKEFTENINNKTIFYYPVKVDDEIISYVITTYNQNMIKESVDKEIMSVILQTGSVAVFVILASFLGTFFISGVLIRPLIELKDKIVNIASKDFKTEGVLDKPLKKEKDKRCIKEITEDCWITAEKPEKVLNEIGDLSIKECYKCEKFKNLSHDEIDELSFSFYMMTASLKDYLQKLEEAHRERETLNCMATMGEMSAKIAHEIKNALYAIGNAANYLKHSIEDETVKEFSGVIKEEVNRLNEMTVSFLNFSKLIEPKFELNDLNAEIERAIMLLKDDFDDENIKVIKELGNIPKFKFDKNMIKQVLFNMLLNSVEALKEKEERNKYIKVKTYVENIKNTNYVVLEIEDNGIGIKEEVKERIFKPFFTTKQNGTGLGLPMVYKIIFSHNGTISIDSEYGKGAKFIIKFKVQ